MSSLDVGVTTQFCFKLAYTKILPKLDSFFVISLNMVKFLFAKLPIYFTHAGEFYAATKKG